MLKGKRWWAMVVALGLLAAGASHAAPIAPFTGIIKNNTPYELSLPSSNSLGTLIVPPKGWVEYVVWDGQFELIPYRDGQPLPWGCQKVQVKPQAYPFMCTHYDFVAEINAPKVAPARPIYKPKKKIRPKKRV